MRKSRGKVNENKSVKGSGMENRKERKTIYKAPFPRGVKALMARLKRHHYAAFFIVSLLLLSF